VVLCLVSSLSEASLPRHAVSDADLRDAAQTLTHISPRAPLSNSKADGITNNSYPGNLTVLYGWDSAGRLTSVKDWGSREWSFSYDGANRLTGIAYPNGVNYSRGYNADGQLTNYVHSKSGAAFINRAIERNAAGMKTREIISAGLEVEQPDTWQKHTSDKADRLTGLTRRDEYVLPENWRGYTPSYNKEGQVTNVTEGYKAWSSDNNLIWDAAGRLVEYTGLRQTNLWTDLPPLPSWGLNLAYDGLGARTVRTDELVTHRMVVDRVGRLRVPLMETDDSNTALRYYIWAPGVGLLAQIEANGTIHYFHTDENGSTLAMTDSNGNVSDQFAYSPWGELLGRTGTNTTAFTFVGGGGVTWEGGSLYRMGARFYDARLKRWLSADPAGMAGGANLYLYCNGNPLYWVDMLGLCGESYFQNQGMSWDEQQSSLILRASPQEQVAYFMQLKEIVKLPGAAATLEDSPTVRSAIAWSKSDKLDGIGTSGSLKIGGVGLFTAAKNTALQKFYPENRGFLGQTERQFLEKGQMIDRYGGNDSSRFFSPAGTPEAARALPPGTSGQPLRTFEVVKPFEVDAGTVTPAFGQLGFGTQFRTPVPMETLMKRGIIQEVRP
jgi:RHS repeat-associated protein